MSDETTQVPQAQDRLQEILLGYVEAAEVGAAPEAQALIAAHPEFAKEIGEFLAGYHQLHRMAAPLRQADERPSATAAIRPALPGRGPGDQSRSTEPPVESATGPVGTELGELGDYRLLREIGRGGMGIVYEAEQVSLRRRVALKILPFAGGADARQLQRFRNEAEAAAHLHHSHIVPVFAVGSERGVHFYAMQFIQGQSLATLIAEMMAASSAASPVGVAGAKPPLARSTVAAITTAHSARTHQFFRQVAGITRQTAEALEYAHQMGVIHRDIKPANLLLDARGDVWITDFGLAQFQSQAGLTLSGELVGTLRYISPEQAMAKKGLVDHRTDIYSLGATLYELLTLQPVFDGKDRHALLHQIGFEDPKPPRAIDQSIPFELETIVLKALAKAPGDRYGSAQELADDLQRFLDDKPIQARRPTLADRGRKWVRRHPSVVIATGVLLVCGLIGFAASTIQIAQEQARTQKAYDDLAIREHQLQAAYADLAKEEKRTKEAYEAEELQRRRAEWDFAQAQRAIELVVQFSEGELAQRPEYQGIRRRLLLTVLDYYEEFLAEHAADPGVQAGREHVALLVTELSNLQGAALLTIIRDVNVQEDLNLTEAQKKQITTYVNSQAKQPAPKGKGPRPTQSYAAVEKAIFDILEPPQRERIRQIVMQVQNQGRYGFSAPKLVEELKLTIKQRELIRQIQGEAHRAWADHVYAAKKLDTPAEFWANVQKQILVVLEPGQRRRWNELAGPPIAVDYREGYPFDGKQDELAFRGPPFVPFYNMWRVGLVIVQDREDRTGSGFGHKAFLSDKQAYAWRGKEIPPTAFEIAVTADPLDKEERALLVSNESRPPPPPAGERKGWLVLFRSADASVWNTHSNDPAKYALPVAQAPETIRYLRLKRMDTGEYQIITIRHADLTQPGRPMPDQEFAWNGTGHEAWGSRHLGIAETATLRGPPPKGPPPKGPKKGPPPG